MKVLERKRTGMCAVTPHRCQALSMLLWSRVLTLQPCRVVFLLNRHLVGDPQCFYATVQYN